MTTFCAQCGKQVNPGARFCSACGAPVAAVPSPAAAYAVAGASRLIRPRAGRMIAGVCQGLALAYGWEVTWVRVIAVLAAVFSSGAGGIAYIIFWIVMPEEPYLLAGPANPYAPPAPAPAAGPASTGWTTGESGTGSTGNPA